MRYLVSLRANRRWSAIVLVMGISVPVYVESRVFAEPASTPGLPAMCDPSLLAVEAVLLPQNVEETVPESIVVDTTIPDTSVPETSVPDTTVPDTTVPESTTTQPPAVDETTPVECPESVSGLSAVAGLNAVTLSWVEPSNADAAGVIEYVVDVRSELRVVSVPANHTSVEISGLPNGAEARFAVHAVGPHGAGPASDEVSATPTTGVEGEVAGIIVKFADPVVVGDTVTVEGPFGVSADLTVIDEVADQVVLIELDEAVSVVEAEAIADDLTATAGVEWAEPDQFLFTATNDVAQPVSVPSDAQWSTSQWNLWDTYGIGIGDGNSTMTDAWASGTGAGSTVAVIDTGITAHPDLDAQIVAGYDFVSNPDALAAVRDASGVSVPFDGDYVDTVMFGGLGRDADPTDPGDWRQVAPIRGSSWHGTQIAGVIAAQANNVQGIVGVAPGAKVQPIRALSWRGGLLSDIASAITWASGGPVEGIPANSTPSNVINLSFAVEAACPNSLQAAIDDAIGRGAVVIASAGNANSNVANFAPANCDGVIAVGATGRDGLRAPYSNWGSGVDLSAPGGSTNGGVLSTSNSGATTPSTPSYANDEGTSVAAAHVAGAAAILRGSDVTLSVAQVIERLTGREFVKQFGGTTCDSDLSKTCGTGILSLAEIAMVRQGAVDYAMSFTGTTNANASYAQSASTDFTSSISDAFTIQLWVRPTSCSNAENTVLIKEHSFGFECGSATGKWRYQLGMGGGAWGTPYKDVTTEAPVLLNQWQHIAITRAGQASPIEFYFNGRLAHTATAWNYPVGNTVGQPLYIGARPPVGQNFVHFFVGQVDDVKLYNTYRGGSIVTDMHTYGPILTNGVATPGLIAYYDFNEGDGTTIFNRVSGASSTTHLTTVNSPNFVDVKTTSTSGSDTVVTFPRSYLTSAGGWVVPQGVSTARTLVVAGGGGGGTGADNTGWQGGGGGAGGYLAAASTALTPGASVAVVVGQGGVGGVRPGVRVARNGQNSQLGSIAAIGGGAGGSSEVINGSPYGSNGATGGSGGGGGIYTGNGGAGMTGQGFAGGNGAGAGNLAAGGGGGSGGAGGNASGVGESAQGGSGGPGTSNDITGAASFYAAGGGGRGCGSNAVDTSAGRVAAESSAAANTGSGGGGGGDEGAAGCTTVGDLAGGNGGSGVVIVRYATASVQCTPERVTDGSYTILAFKDVGTCTWTVPAGVTNVDYLVVGGGGGGGGHIGGGGGGGEVVTGTRTGLTTTSSYSITVGAGGAGGKRLFDNAEGHGTNGGESSAFAVSGVGGIRAAGGGFGATLMSAGSTGGSGGSGGGGGGSTGSAGQVSKLSSGFGNIGGTGTGGCATAVAGGGGGGGSVGENGAVDGTGHGGDGGSGLASNITGVTSYYAGGGGGGLNTGTPCVSVGNPGEGGTGGGGAAGPKTASTANVDSMGVDGLANTGGGGGGASGNGQTSTSRSGGNGGSGVVIIRYTPVDASCAPLTYTSGAYTVVEFQTAGTCAWTVPSGVTSVDVLAVGGGGGGGAWVGAGGGGGGVTETMGVSVSAGSTVDVLVGAGGVGSILTSTFTAGSNGQPSQFGSATPVIALGGGVGASIGQQLAGGGASVATGGGSADPNLPAGSGTGSGSALVGGAASSDQQPHPVGGGAGAGGNGLNGSGSGSSWSSGAGGPGKISNLTGATVHYGGGGGGSAHGTWPTSTSWDSSVVITPGVGGVGGGGAGGRVVSSAGAVYGFDGVDGLGGGGGGSANYGPAAATPSYGGDGGDGMVIVRYATRIMSKVEGDNQTGPINSALPINPKVRIVDANGNGVDGVTVTFAVATGGGSVGSASVVTSGGGYAETTWTPDSVGTNTITATATDTADSPVTFTAMGTNSVCDVEFTELNFDFARARLTNGNTLPTNHGKAQGNVVLFRNVLTRCGGVDAVVTTSALVSATIDKYESGAQAGGENSYFQADVNFSANNGYAEFTFAFYKSGTVTNSAEAVTLKNVKITAIDIDYYQFNDFTDMNAYTLAGNTRLLVQNRTPATGFPVDARFQGPSGIDSNSPRDQVVATYGEIDTFKIRFGRSRSGSPNYFGVAFKELGWGSSTPNTAGANYTITYDGNDEDSGSEPSSQTAALGADVTIRSNTGSLVRAGYTFGGWNTAANGSGTTYLAGEATFMPQDGMTLYAVWTPVSYTVTYNANGGSGAPSGSSAQFGATVTVSASTPTRAGYSFTGWNTQANGSGTPYASSDTFSMPSNNVTLYAQWQVSTVVLTYDKNTGDTVANVPVSVSANAGSSLTLSSNTPVRTGYTFTGWNTQANGSGTSYARSANFTMPSTDVTLSAQWSIKSYTLTYNLNGGSGTAPSSQTGNYDTTVSARTTTANRTGYSFAGWTVNADGTGTSYQPNDSYTLVTDATLYAKWTPITYTIHYAPNDDATSSATNLPSAQTPITYQQSVSLSATLPTRAGYIFNGWNTAADGSGTGHVSEGTFVMPANDVTLSAQWIPDIYDLLYNANGGANAPLATEHTSGSTATITSSVPTRVGYTFLHWTTTSAGTGTTYLNPGSGGSVSSFTMPAQHVTMYAQWQVNQYTVTYNANFGSGAPSSQTENYGDTVTVSGTVPTRSGYQFTGWNTATGGTGTAYASSGTFVMPADNVTLYAQWEALTYQLVYNVNGGSSAAPASQNGATGTQLTVSNTTPTRTGYTFTGWNTAADGSGTPYSGGASVTMIPDGITLYAHWTANPYTVTYNANNGSGAPSSQSQTTDSTVTVSATVPTRAGYTFLGWNTVQNGSGVGYQGSGTFTMPPNNVTLYAQWSADNFTITYDANGGSGAPASSVATTDSTATVSATVPVRTGYTFLGWNTAANGSGTSRASSSTFTMPAANVTFYAQWAPQTFVVAYNANGGSGAPANQPGVVDTTVTVSNTVPARTGYTFAGWNTAADGSGTAYTGGGTFTMPANNVTLYAQWTAITYTITYHGNLGSGVPAASTHTYLEAVTLSATVPTRTGYWFNGWNTLANGNGSGHVPSANLVMPASDLDLYAQWVPDIYRVVYNANGGTGAPSDQLVSTSATVTVSATQPSRTGYTFLSWSTTSAGTPPTYSANAIFPMPPNNTTLYAQWQINQYQVIYNANQGSGTPPTTQIGDFQSTVVIDEPTDLTRVGYTFTGWNTEANGSGIAYPPGFEFVIPAVDTTLYAQWFADTNAIIYDTTGGSGGPDNDFAATNSNVTVSSTIPTRPGYTFSHWQDTQGNLYANPVTGSAIATFTMPGNSIVLYAVWTINSYTLTYDANGGSGAPAGSTFDFDESVTVSATTPTRGGFNFVDWNTLRNGSGTTYAPSATFSMPASDVTLYAQWSAIPAAPQLVPPGGGGGNDNDDSGKTPGPGNRDLPDPDTKETRPNTPVTIDPITTEPPADDDWDTETMRIIDPVTQDELTKVVTPDGTWELDLNTGLVNFTPADGFFGRAEVEFVITTKKGVTYRAQLSVFVARLGPTIPATGAETSTVLVWGMWMLVAGLLTAALSRRRRLF